MYILQCDSIRYSGGKILQNGRKDVLEINMLAEVARRQSRTQLSAYLMVFEAAYAKQASVNEETRPNKARTPKNTNNFEPCVARTTRGLAKM